MKGGGWGGGVWAKASQNLEGQINYGAFLEHKAGGESWWAEPLPPSTLHFESWLGGGGGGGGATAS